MSPHLEETFRVSPLWALPGLLAGIRDAVDADVDDGGSRLEPLALDKARLADCSHDYVGLRARLAAVMAGGMAEGYAESRTSRTVAAMSAVREWHTVTVAFSASRRWATGMPTMLERPMTTARFPSMGML